MSPCFWTRVVCIRLEWPPSYTYGKRTGDGNHSRSKDLTGRMKRQTGIFVELRRMFATIYDDLMLLAMFAAEMYCYWRKTSWRTSLMTYLMALYGFDCIPQISANRNKKEIKCNANHKSIHHKSHHYISLRAYRHLRKSASGLATLTFLRSEESWARVKRRFSKILNFGGVETVIFIMLLAIVRNRQLWATCK